MLAAAPEKGLTVVEPDPELSRVVRAFAEQDGERAATAARDREGIVDAAQILQRYRELYAKYATLFGAAPMQEQQAGILMREIYGKLDPERYARSEEHTSELQSLMRISYAVFCLKKKNKIITQYHKHKQLSHTIS